MVAETRRIEGADGISLMLYEWSPRAPTGADEARSRVPLLLIHGFGNDSHVWDELAPALAPYYRTLGLDMRGHGDSDWDPERRYDHLSMTRDVEAVCDALGIERLVLVGHSMGGRVAMRFAGRNPGKLAGLIIVDSGPELDARGTTRIRMEASEREPVFGSLREYEEVLARNYPVTKPATIAHLARHWSRQRDDGLLELKMDPAMSTRRPSDPDVDLEQWMRDEAKALWEALAGVPCPTLVVRGAASDVLSADAADRMVDDVLAQGRLAVVSRAGHSVMTDNPDELRDVVCAFVLGED